MEYAMCVIIYCMPVLAIYTYLLPDNRSLSPNVNKWHPINIYKNKKTNKHICIVQKNKGNASHCIELIYERIFLSFKLENCIGQSFWRYKEIHLHNNILPWEFRTLIYFVLHFFIQTFVLSLPRNTSFPKIATSNSA